MSGTEKKKIYSQNFFVATRNFLKNIGDKVVEPDLKKKSPIISETD